VLRALRQKDPAAKIIIVSGNSQQKVYDQLAKEGAAAFVDKPIKEDDVKAAIARATGA
jgi:FixJ family two-component response regulator